MEHINNNKWIYLSLIGFVVVTYFFSVYALGYGQSGIQSYILDHSPFIKSNEILPHLDRLGAGGVEYYRGMYIYGYDFMYPLGFSVFCFLVLQKASKIYPWLRFSLVLPLALFVADCSENFLILNALNSYPEPVWSYEYIGYAVGVKAGIKMLSYVFLIMSLLVLAGAKVKGSAK